MCGRYTLTRDDQNFCEQFSLSLGRSFKPRFNIAPGQKAPVILRREERPVLEELGWGLVPSWARDESVGNKLINARCESVAQKPSFRSAFQKRRCLVVADGYYEWMQQEGKKVPFRFQAGGGGVFGLAGLWEEWKSGEGGVVRNFTVLTMPANEAASRFHHRMPVILPVGQAREWLEGEPLGEGAFGGMLEEARQVVLEARQANRLVNNARNDSPECLAADSPAELDLPPLGQGVL